MSKKKRQKTKRKAGASPVPEEAWWEKGWVPFALIAGVGALAHIWCLNAVFYMDDLWKIRDSYEIEYGSWWKMSLQQWTYFWWSVQWHLFGKSPVGYHAVNWLLHVAVAVVTYLLGRELLRESGHGRGLALAGALLFVSVPLGSEILNYARAQDLAWVVLFSLLACWFFAKWAARGGFWWLLLVPLMVAGATFSKGPGIGHALMMLALVVVTILLKERRDRKRRKSWIIGIAALGILVLLIAFPLLEGRWEWALARFERGNFQWHAVTLCRVFWQFIGLFFNPSGLSADHMVAETRSWKDIAAVWAVAGVAVWTLLSLGLLFWRKSRVLGVCLFLTVGAILYRFLFYTNEYMPEYRIYPALPWFSLAVVIVVHGLWRALRINVSPAPLMGLVLIVASFLSAKRSFLWHDLDDLMANVLEQYPAQSRAIWILHRRDIDNGEIEAVIRRQQSDWPKLAKTMRDLYFAEKELREHNSGLYWAAHAAVKGIYARAVAEKVGPLTGLGIIDQLEAELRQMEIKQDLHWQIFRRQKGFVLEIAGRYDEALELLEDSAKGNNFHADYLRVKALAEGKKSPEGG
ncbi:MAG: hypothetical protein AAGA58_03025 [Verrucomicrobiota bacterium]